MNCPSCGWAFNKWCQVCCDEDKRQDEERKANARAYWDNKRKLIETLNDLRIRRRNNDQGEGTRPSS